MNKELIKQLKECGYTAELDLASLIKSCGEDFRTLILHTQYNKKLDKAWEAVPNKKLRPESKSKKGKTPEEAVSNLWFNLQIKKLK